MRKDLTEIIFVLDESGSMGSVRNDTIGGFNTFIQDQIELPGEAIVTLAVFDTSYRTIEQGTLIESVVGLSNETYRPGGGTALLDAVGKTINDVVARHADLDETERPEKVILVVMTDGEENSSREFKTPGDIGKMVGEREEAGWEVIFLGADIDAWTDGARMGFSKSRGMSKSDMLGNMSKVSNYTASYRSGPGGQSVNSASLDDTFDMSPEELNKQMKGFKGK